MPGLSERKNEANQGNNQLYKSKKNVEGDFCLQHFPDMRLVLYVILKPFKHSLLFFKQFKKLIQLW
jgi:hypothetical protein